MVDEDAEDAGMDAAKSSGPQPTDATTIMQRLGSPPRAFDGVPKGVRSVPDMQCTCEHFKTVQMLDIHVMKLF